MTINWKKTGIIIVDSILAVYLLLAITAFNRPDEVSHVCNEVKINIEEGIVKGFLNADNIKLQLQRARLYPLGDPMRQVSSRQIEETLQQDPFVEKVECYKTENGRVIINLTQRMPVIRVIADNGENYYIDEHGNVMPDSYFASDLAVASGNIQKPFAKKTLRDIGLFLLKNPLWRSQVEQLHVLPDHSIEMVPRVGDHIVYLGQPVDIEHKFSRLEKFYRYGLPKAGWNKYSYISLEFSNQIICKKK